MVGSDNVNAFISFLLLPTVHYIIPVSYRGHPRDLALSCSEQLTAPLGPGIGAFDRVFPISILRNCYAPDTILAILLSM